MPSWQCAVDQIAKGWSVEAKIGSGLIRQLDDEVMMMTGRRRQRPWQRSRLAVPACAPAPFPHFATSGPRPLQNHPTAFIRRFCSVVT
jgi:hypothetical protein